jgi:peptide/nickel transport system substrate-binding protein
MATQLLRAPTLVLAMILAVTACAPRQADAPAQGQPQAPAQAAAQPKRIVAAIRGDPRTLNDAISSTAGGSSVAGVREIEQLLNAGLGVVDDRSAVQPQLAETVPSVENGQWRLFPDGRMETTWRLKANARWQDGTAFTADDVVFSVMVGQDAQLAMNQDEYFKFIDGVTATDGQTVVVNWNRPYIAADALLTKTRGQSLLPMPKHLVGATYAENKEAFVQSPRWGEQYIGTGPYRLNQWVPGSHLLLDANDQYVLGKPKIDRIEVKFILDTNTMVANLLAGALHMTLGRGLTPEQAILVQSEWREGRVDAGLQNTTVMFPQFLDANPSALTDVRMRRALLHAMDRQQMVDVFLSGLVPVAHSIWSPEEPEARDLESATVKYPYDPRRSVEILEGMGLTKNAEGRYLDPSGRPLAFELRSRAHALREKLQPVIKEEWQRVGLDAEVLIVPEQRVSDRVYQATFPGFYFRFMSPDISIFKSTTIALPENNYTGSNPGRYRNPELDTLIDQYFGTIPKGERMDVLRRVAALLTDQLIVLPVYHEPEPVLIHKSLLHAAGRKGESVQAWNAHLWDLAP